jgi:hypothetical protein
MKKSTSKLIIAIAVVVGVSAAIAKFSIWVAAVTCLILLFETWARYDDRCRFCGSWRIKTTWKWQFEGEPGFGVSTETRRCKGCGITEINHRKVTPYTVHHFRSYR